MPPTLIVTVDTEEEGLWNGEYRATGHTVENTRGIPRFQALCDQFDIRPTYLVDTPVVQDDRSVELLSEIQRSGRCEIGAHLHPWCAPPFSLEEKGDSPHLCVAPSGPFRQMGTVPFFNRDTYLCNLPGPLQRAKLTRLTEEIEERFGRRPTSFRAGRYGLDMTGARILKELGYWVDSSVIPFSDFSADGGPDFRAAPYQPYFLDGDDICMPHEEGFLREIPVSVGYSHHNFARAARLRSLAARPILRSCRMIGILDRLGIARRIKFSPEQADARRMRQLVDAFCAQQTLAVVMMFHSSSLVPGYSPYVPDTARLEQFFKNLEATFEYCLSEQGMVGMTLSTFAERYSNPISNRN